MKIALLGATGPTGLQVIAEALDRGHEIVALVRNPDKIETKHDKLHVEKIDIFNEDELTKNFKGCDVIMSSLGAPPSFFGMSNITFYTDSIKPMVSAMRKSNLTRLVCVTAWNTKAGPSGSTIFDWVIRPLVLGKTLQNMNEMEDYLQSECKDIRYTVVKPPGLTNLPSSGKTILSAEGHSIPNIPRRLSRRDVAKYMLDVVDKEEVVHKLMAIGVDP